MKSTIIFAIATACLLIPEKTSAKPSALLSNITILLNGPDTVFLEVFDIYQDQGATATNSALEDVSDQLVVTNNVNNQVLGNYTVVYSIFSAQGFTYTASRVVVVVDTKAPVIRSKINRDTIHHDLGRPFVNDSHIVITDNYWNIPVSNVTRTGNIHIFIPGIYTLRYNVADSSGNVANEFVLWVSVKDTTRPQITLNGRTVEVVDVFNRFDDPGVTATDDIFPPTITQNPTFVNTNVLGRTIITYTATDQSGNTASVQRIVDVVDRISPTIQLVGPSNLAIPEGAWLAEIDPGVLVSDNYDPREDIFILIDSSAYDRNRQGSYVISYRATDKSGHQSSIVLRTIKVFGVGLRGIENNNATMSVYPNPTKGVFKIDHEARQGAEIKIFDVRGKCVYSAVVDNPIAQVDLTAYEPGFYFVQLRDESATYTAKIQLLK
jgi:hypothetical protein